MGTTTTNTINTIEDTTMTTSITSKLKLLFGLLFGALLLTQLAGCTIHAPGIHGKPGRGPVFAPGHHRRH